MYAIYRSTAFKKDLKRAVKNPRFRKDIFTSAINALAVGEALPPRYRNHKLTGEFSNCFECHLQPDMLLIYLIDKNEGALRLVCIGSHAELFG